jgi:predicted HTH transcriptional regulator
LAEETFGIQIVKPLGQYPVITRLGLAEKLRRGQAVVQEQLVSHKRKGIIVRLGRDGKGEWQVAEFKMPEA